MSPRHSSAVCFAFFLAAAVPASAQVTTRVSLATGGLQGNAASYAPSLSANGRYVAFYSEASNLVPGDLNGAKDIFWRDRRSGVTERISVSSTGFEANGDSYSPALSADGRFVTYYSAAANLVPGDTNGVYDAFLFDRVTATTSRVSVDSSGVEGNQASYYSMLPADGRFVVFQSLASNLVAGDTNGQMDIFLHDNASGVNRRLSVNAAGVQGDDMSEYPSVSADGRRVLFLSRASNLVPGDLNGASDVFVRDLVSGTLSCVSVDPNGFPGLGTCGYASISGDGQVVAFGSGAPNLVPGDSNGVMDVFVRKLVSGTTTRINVSSAGVQATGGMSQIHSIGALSYDGRYVVFKSAANNLVANDTNGAQDIFLRDCRLGITTRENVDSFFAEANGTSSQPAISADGKHIGFYSYATNLVFGDLNWAPDVFVRSL